MEIIADFGSLFIQEQGHFRLTLGIIQELVQGLLEELLMVLSMYVMVNGT